MVVHMTGLYTRLVTYARLHILTLVVSFYHDTSYISFIVLFLTLIISLSFILVYYVVIAYIVIMHEHFFIYTHSLGRFWRPWIRTSRVLDIFLYCSSVRVNVRFARSWSFSLFDSGILALFPAIILWFLCITLSFYSIPYFIWDHV